MQIMMIGSGYIGLVSRACFYSSGDSLDRLAMDLRNDYDRDAPKAAGLHHHAVGR